MIHLWITLTIILLILIYILTRDYANPAFISGIVWLGVYFILTYFKQFITDDMHPNVFFYAFLFFTLGFFVPMRRISITRIVEIKPIHVDVSWEPIFERMLIITEYAISIIYVILCYSNLRSYGRSIWQTFRYTASQTEFINGWLPGFFRDAITTIFILSVAFYFLNPTKYNKKILLIGIPPLLITLLFATRSGWFMVIISIAFLYIYIRRPRGRKVALIGLLGLALLLFIFMASSFDKFSNAYTWENNQEKILRYISGYFASPPIAFMNFISSDYTHQNGLYTFRFLCALLHIVFPEVEVVQLIQPYVTVVGYPSNVYTALHWYAIDYGFWWACFVEFILGIVYGKLYKKVRMDRTSNIFPIVMLSLLMFPIAAQFFDEKLFSSISSWIQRLVVIAIVLKSPLSSISND